MGVAQIFPTFYTAAPTSGAPEIGEFYWVPTPDVTFKVIEAIRSTPQATKSYEVTLKDFDAAKHFRTKGHLPTKLVTSATGEALLFQAKLRPCLVLGAGSVSDLATIADPSQRRQAKVLGNAAYLVAPLYSSSCAAKPTTFTPVITARVRALQYPHMAYMPDFDGHEPGSILRLDNVFPTTLGVGMNRLGKRLHQDVHTLVLAQLCEVLKLDMPDDWREHLKATKDLVKDCLPDGLQ
jgi:hypothetical protein